MSCERVFLGWDAPALPTAARWLVERFGEDMGGVTMAVPSRRVGLRLEELLAEALAGRLWTPPEMVTADALAEALYDVPDAVEAAGGVLGDLEATLARMAALNEVAPDALAAVVSRPPAADDVRGRWAVAQELGQLSDTLAGAGLSVGEVVDRAAAGGVDLGAVHESRWPELARLEDAYARTRERPDRGEARRRAAAGQWRSSSSSAAGAVVLLGVTELDVPTRVLLERSAEVVALVAAPDAHAERFDGFGTLRGGAGYADAVRVDDLRVVNNPTAQAAAVAGALVELRPHAGTADRVSVGMGDPAGGAALGRRLDAAGVPVRVAAGYPVLRGGPAVLLAAVARYARTRRFDALAELTRHPDLDGGTRLADLDAYRSERLAGLVAGEPLGAVEGQWSEVEDRGARAAARQAAAVQTLRGRAERLLPKDAEQSVPWPRRSAQILETLGTVYGKRTLHRERDQRLVDGLKAVGQALAEQMALAAEDNEAPRVGVPRVTFAQAIELTLRRLAGRTLPEPGGEAAVELLAFPELAWDDAPCAVLTDVNEGLVPAGGGADAFLPDPLRTALGLPDRRQRLERDAYLMNLIAHSREHVVTLTCREADAGDPRLPSRLLLADAADDVKVTRVTDFFGEDSAQEASAASGGEAGADAGLASATGDLPRVELVLPRPGGAVPADTKEAGELNTYSPSRLKTYLACPYRYYLSKVAKLNVVDDRRYELDRALFGTLAHAVLEDFARSELAHADDVDAVDQELRRLLKLNVARSFGEAPEPVVRVQVRQLAARLERFAVDQVAEVRKGWRIDPALTEKPLEVDYTTTHGVKCRLNTRIDRVDRHTDGRVRVIDYKTFETVKKPAGEHKKKGRWINVQLPMYRHVAMQELGVANVETAYWVLPAASKDGGVLEPKKDGGRNAAVWSEDDYSEAMQEASWAIEQIEGGVFWPPKLPPPYDDGFARLCADGSPDRARLIETRTRAMSQAKTGAEGGAA